MCESECDSSSETEEMELNQDDEADILDTAADNNQESESESFLPVETIDRKESVEIWKSKNETDVIGMSNPCFK